MSGIIDVSPDMRSGVVGELTSGTILASHQLTAGTYSNSGGTGTYRMSGPYWSFTTQPQTNRILVWGGAQTNIFIHDGDYASGTIAMYFHDSTSTGGTPSGSIIGGLMTTAPYFQNNTTDIQFRTSTVVGGKATVSGSTAYIVALFTKYDVGGYIQLEASNGVLIELKE